MSSIFVIVPAATYTPALVQQIQGCLSEHGARIDASDLAPGHTLRLHSGSLDTYFGATHHWAASVSEDVLTQPLMPETSAASFCSAEEDLKSLFFQHYGELWDGALAERRLRTAYDMLEEDKGTSAATLAQRCAHAVTTTPENVLTLPLRLTVTRLADNPSHGPARYVVNGTYPAQRDAFLGEDVDGGNGNARLGSDKDACWWCAATMAVTATATAAKDATELAVSVQSLSADLIDVVTSPLAALAARVAWTHVPLDLDPVARLVLQRGVPLPWLQALLRDPVLHDRGNFQSVFGMVEGQSSTEAAETLANLWRTLSASDTEAADAEEEEDARNGEAEPALYDYADGYLGPVSAYVSAAAPRTHAVVLVHPRLMASAELASRLEEELPQHNIRVDAVKRVVSVEELEAKLDLHYDPVSRYAMDQAALRRLDVDEAAAGTVADTMADFENATGTPWAVAMEEGRIWSVSLLQELLGAAPAEALLHHCTSAEAETHHLSPTLAITAIPRETLTDQLDSQRPLHRPRSTQPTSTKQKKQERAAAPAAQPYGLVPQVHFVVNAAYGVYRRDVLDAARATPESCGEVWQVSSAQGSEADLVGWCRTALAAAPTTTATGSADADRTDAKTEGTWNVEAAYRAVVGDCVGQQFPLLNMVVTPAAAMRARHLWWGTPYDEDVLSQQMRCVGQSWTSVFVPHGTASQDEKQEAVLALLPTVATNPVIQLTRAALHESYVTVIEEADLYDAEAAAYAFGGGSSLAAACRLAGQSGPALWAEFSVEERAAFPAVVETARAAAVAREEEGAFVADCTPSTILGGAAVCAALRISLGTLSTTWHAARPTRVSSRCWLAYLAAYEVWVVNGQVPLWQRRYSAETPVARVHLLRVRWPKASISWADMQSALLGSDRSAVASVGISTTAVEPLEEEETPKATAGSLTVLLRRIAAKQEHPNATCDEPLCLLSATPYDAVVDVLRWPRRGTSNPLRSEVALEDWLLRQPYVHTTLLGGSNTACAFSFVVQQVRTVASSVSAPQEQPARAAFMSHAPSQWCGCCLQQQRDSELHHGFLWLHPASTTAAVCDAIPAFLRHHRVDIRAAGFIPLRDVISRQLLDVHHDPFYKNARTRTASQVPITDAEAEAFTAAFGQCWTTVVRLGLVLSAREAEERYGAVHLVTWWDSLAPAHQAYLSDALLIGYMADDGVYVMNPPYNYRRARLYAGSDAVAWCSVTWPRDAMTWETFMVDVVGNADPAVAVPGSLRHTFATQWTQLRLPGKPDAIECVLHASDSPLAALAERCRWLDYTPAQDPYGCVLLQAGVHPQLLTLLLSNPALHHSITEQTTAAAFDTFQQDDVHELIGELRACQHSPSFLILPEALSFIPSAPAPARDARRSEDASDLHAHDDLPSSLSTLCKYRSRAIQTNAVSPFLLCAYARAFGGVQLLATQDSPSASLCEAVMYLDPIDESLNGGAFAEVTQFAAASSGTNSNVINSTPTVARHAALRRLLEQRLRLRGIHVVHERVVRCATAAAAKVLYRHHHRRLYRYGVKQPAAETFAHEPDFALRFKQQYKLPHDSAAVELRNAAEMATALQATGRDVATLWRRARDLYPRDTLILGEECVVQRLQPGKPFFILNGDAIEAEEHFAATQCTTGVRVWLLRWDSTCAAGAASGSGECGYARVAQIVTELQQATRGALQVAWNTYEWGKINSSDNHSRSGSGGVVVTHAGSASASGITRDARPCLHVSESALAAVQQRQLWWGLPLSTDGTVHDWVRHLDHEAPLTLSAVASALHDPLIPRRGIEDAAFLFDTVMGMDAPQVRTVLVDVDGGEPEKAAATLERRNTAVIALLPHVAANTAIHQLVRTVMQEQELQVEEEGFIACDGAGGRGQTGATAETVRCLCPDDWSYATQEPSTIQLTTEEAQQVEATFGVSWSTLLEHGRLLPAARATKRLGGMTAAQLRLFVKSAKTSLWLRPHLHLASLEEYGVTVLNAHVSHLHHAIQTVAQETPLPYYVVSWDASQISWEEMLRRVVGDVEPSLAAPGSIRGRVYACWSALRLRAPPERGSEAVVSVSEDPASAWLAQSYLPSTPSSCFEESKWGTQLLRLGGPQVRAVVRVWFENPIVICDGHAGSVLSHLRGWNTDEAVRLMLRVAHTPASLPLPESLAKVRQDERERHIRQAADAAWAAVVQDRDILPLLLSDDAASAAAPPTTLAPPLSPLSSTSAEDSVVHRNDGVLLFFSDALDTAQRARLRQHLHEHGVLISVKADEAEQECTPALLERLFATESFFATCSQLAQVLRNTNEVATEDQARFHAVFRDEVAWPELLRRTMDDVPAVAAADVTVMDGGLYSAADAMRLLGWTAAELWRMAQQHGTSMRLSDGIEIARCPLAKIIDKGEGEDGFDHHNGHVYIVNAAYAALCASVTPAVESPDEPEGEGKAAAATLISPAPPLTMWNISWDSRTLAWQEVFHRVIGVADGARAAPGSFNASLVQTPSLFTSLRGVMAASGSIAAFAMRRRWCWSAGRTFDDAYCLDPFVRAMAVAGLADDATVVKEWLTDALLTFEDGTRRRVMDLTRSCDTPAVLRWMRRREEAAVSHQLQGRGSYSMGDATAEAADQKAMSNGSSPARQRQATPPSPPPRLKTRLHTARVRDALLHARTQEDWRRLWNYYATLNAPAATAATTPTTATAADTIPFAPFYRDFRSLDTFGVPYVDHQLKTLFVNVEASGRGRMTFAEFTQALSLYHSL